jgi:putative membrane protein
MKQRLSVLAAQFNGRMLLVRWLVYALVLLAVALLVPKIYFTDRRVWVWLMVAAGFGILNSIIRPLIQALMLQLFFASLGLVVALINGFMLYLLSWTFPNRFAVDSFLWALVGGLLVALLGSFLEGLFGLTRPIVPESGAELRQRLKAQDRSLVYTFLKARPAPLVSEEALPGLPSPALDVPPPEQLPSAQPEAPETSVTASQEAPPEPARRIRRPKVRRKAAAPSKAELAAGEPVETPGPQQPAGAPEAAEPATGSAGVDTAAGVPDLGEEAGA